MTREQAREILQLWRPWAKDAQDEEFAEALAFARADAELSAWLREQSEAHEAVRARLKAIPMPEALKEQIVSEHASQKIVRLGRREVPWYAVAVAAAAVIVLMFVLTGREWNREELGFEGYRNRMVRSALRVYAMDLETNDVAQVRAYLGANRGNADFAMPSAVAQKPLVGCGIKNWQGKPVSMVCFRSGKPLPPNEKSDLFLFVADRNWVEGAPDKNTMLISKVNSLHTATWTEGGQVYLLAATDEATLKELLPVKQL